MSAARPQFSIDDAFELSLEDAGPGLESSGVTRFGPLHFERRARFEVADEDKQSRLRYQVNGPAHLTPWAGPQAGARRTPTRRLCLETPAGAGDRPADVAPDPEPCPDPLSSDFGRQPPLESPETGPGTRPPPLAGDPIWSLRPCWVPTLPPFPPPGWGALLYLNRTLPVLRGSPLKPRPDDLTGPCTPLQFWKSPRYLSPQSWRTPSHETLPTLDSH